MTTTIAKPSKKTLVVKNCEVKKQVTVEGSNRPQTGTCIPSEGGELQTPWLRYSGSGEKLVVTCTSTKCPFRERC